MKMNEAWLDSYMRNKYINFNLNFQTKFSTSSRSIEFKDILQEYIWGDLKDHPSQHKNSHMMCIEKDHTLLSLQERSEYDQNFSIEGKPL